MDRWPEPVAITLKEKASSSVWNFIIPPRAALKPHTLRAPLGSYTMVIAAAHNHPIHRDVQLNDQDADLGDLTLFRYPVLTGSVRASDGSPLAGALVTAGTKHSVKSDLSGAFSMEIQDQRPSFLEFVYPGLATKQIAVPETQISLNLPPVTLVKGSALTVDIEGLDADCHVDLAREDGYRHIRVLKTLGAKKESPQVVFEDLEKARYVVIIRGDGPLQKFACSVSVADDDSTVRKIRLEPLTATIEVRRGDALLPGIGVSVISDGNHWSSELRTDSNGRVSAVAWQRGKYAFAVHPHEGGVPTLLVDDIEGITDANVNLEVPDRMITGEVIDADNGAVVENAKVHLESDNDDETSSSLVEFTKANGKFAIEGIKDGTHKLTADADGFLRSESIAVRIDRATPRQNVQLSLSRGVSRIFRLTDPRGVPVRAAAVIETVGGEVVGTYLSDDSGQTVVRTIPGSSAVVFVLPAEGSFAIARIEMKPSPGEYTVVVPDGNATLEVHTKDSTGKAVGNVSFVIRYNGELIPPQIAEFLEMRRGIRAATGSDGVGRLERLPPGLFELWPLRTRQEMRDIFATATFSAPVQVPVKEGLNVASLTFGRR